MWDKKTRDPSYLANLLDINYLYETHRGRETALFLSPSRRQQAELAPKPKAEAAQAPETPTIFPLLFEELLAGLSKPLRLSAGS